MNIKLLLKISFVCAALLTVSSCKKNRTCTCDYVTSQFPAPNTAGTDVLPLGKTTQSEAEDACSDYQDSYSSNPYYSTSTCTVD